MTFEPDADGSVPGDWHEALAFAEDLADTARPIAMRHFRKTLKVDTKTDGSPVTVADRAIERTLRTMIGARYPQAGIYGEEFGAEMRASTWILDPIDGTKSFVTGLPLFGTLIALVEDGRPVFGVIDMPALGERWTGTSEGAHFNGTPVWTSGCRSIDGARLYTTSPDSFSAEGLVAFERLGRTAAMRRFGGDCYAYGLLASGYCDLVVEEGLLPYDFMALVCIIEGAGGVISDWSGQPLGFNSDGRVVAAATRELHAAALRALSL